MGGGVACRIPYPPIARTGAMFRWSFVLKSCREERERDREREREGEGERERESSERVASLRCREDRMQWQRFGYVHHATDCRCRCESPL